jgi:putative FmdB family regulatory protein
MPYYEYMSAQENSNCKYCKDKFEVIQLMNELPLTKCPECQMPVKKLISCPAAFIVLGRTANQYKDIKAAKYWRDKDGVRHKVTAADGHTGSATVSKQTATPEQIKQRKKQDQEANKARRMKLQKDRADQWNKDNR